MGHGIPFAKVQRAERNKIAHPHQIQLSTKGHILELQDSTNTLVLTYSHHYHGKKTHIDRISKKANSMLGFLRRNLRSCKEDTKANAYFNMVRSNLEYCSSVWNPHHNDQVHKVEMVQRRAARFTTNRYRNTSSVSSMLNHLQRESLEARRSKIQLTFFYKMVFDLVDIPASTYLTPSTARTRSSRTKKFRQSSPSTDCFKFSFFPGTIPLWNSLPAVTAEYLSRRDYPPFHSKFR